MPTSRKSPRIPLNAEVLLRRSSQNNYRVRIFDASVDGGKIEFIERPALDERLWVKFEGLEAIEATVCWIEGHVVGIEFERAIHPAVFQHLVAKISGHFGNPI